jgi:hypothetical protein
MKWLKSFFSVYFLSVSFLFVGIFTFPTTASASTATLEAWQQYNTDTVGISGSGITFNLYTASTNYDLGALVLFGKKTYTAVNSQAHIYFDINGIHHSTLCDNLNKNIPPQLFTCYPNATTTVHTGDIIQLTWFEMSPDTMTAYGVATTTGGYPFIPYAEIWSTGKIPTGIDLKDNGKIQLTCGITDVSACVINAFAWAFSPDSTIFDQFATLKDEIKNKPPFGYFTSAIDSIATLNSSSTHAFTLSESAPIMNLIFDPLRAGLAWVLYFGGLIWLYKRLSNITI